MSENKKTIIVVVVVLVIAVICCSWSGGAWGGALPSTTTLDGLAIETESQEIDMHSTHVFKDGEDLIAIYVAQAYTGPGEIYTFYWSKKSNGQWTEWEKVDLGSREVFDLPSKERHDLRVRSKPNQVAIQGVTGYGSKQCSHILICRPKLDIQFQEEGG